MFKDLKRQSPSIENQHGRNLRCSKYPKHEQEDDDDRWYVSTWAGGSKRVRPHEASFALDVAFTQQANYNSNTLASAVQFLHHTMTPNCAAVRLRRIDYQSRLATRQRARYHCTVCIILSVKSVFYF